MNKFLLALSASAVLTASAYAVPGTMEFSYNNGDGEMDYFGYNKTETYDVAIRIADPVVVGAQITGLRVKLPVSPDDMKDLSAWMTKELRLENKKNVADIEVKTAEFADSVLSVTFDTPYTIPAEGVYVGYSLTITNRNGEGYPGYPVAVVPGTNPDGFYVHTSRSRLKWTSMTSTTGCVSAMVVNLATDFGEYDATISVPETSYVEADALTTIPTVIVNHGAHPLNYFEYTFSAGDVKDSRKCELATPLEKLGDSATVNLEIGPFPKLGTFDLNVTVDSFNGEPNNDAYKSSKGELNVIPFVPVTRPLVEEFTGLGCGYCPRGYVAMEEMNEMYGDMFVGMAFHSQSYENGCMVTVSNSNFPVSVEGFPSGDIDRQLMMDPSYFPSMWPSFQDRIAPADIDVTMDWADASHSEFVIDATTKFIKDYDNANFKLAIALVADNVYNESWGQSNYYSGQGSSGSDLWDLFTKGDKTVYGLIFNDVVAYFKNTRGIEGSVPSKIVTGEEMKYTYRIKKSDVKNVRGEDFLPDDAKIHAVAILLDGDTGFSVNCNKSADLLFGDTDAVETIETDATVESVRYYDLQGREVVNPTSGIMVKAEKLSDGTVRYTKTAVR